VYLPDWLDEARLAYTDDLARLLAALLPADREIEGSVSTVPGAFRGNVHGEAEETRMADLLVRHVATLYRLHEDTGRMVALALEPEPCCHLETVAETVAFFERHLFARSATRRLAATTGLADSACEMVLRRHLGVCLDACHMAVEFEEPRAALDALRGAGIRVVKAQLSAGLQARLGGDDASTRAALAPFAEGVYLHQVVERRDGTLRRFLDLPEALATATRPGPPREWRIHFHVPLFRETLGSFTNTQRWLASLLEILAREPHTGHLEVETYTWDVLPEEHRREDIVTAVARELAWVLERLPA
jgi:hypothetical protein